MNRRRIAAGLALAAGLVLLLAAPAAAQDTKPTLDSLQSGLDALTQDVNLLWIVIGAALVIFMQAGFAMVETGFCRAKHSAHVVSTNFAIFGLGFVAYFIVGYAFMFGGYSASLFGYDHAVGSGSPWIGSGHWVFVWNPSQLIALRGLWSISMASHGLYVAAVMGFFLYMVAFMDTTATIPTGAMAERWKWNAFIGWGLFCGAVFYPLFGGWTWGGGWLAQLGNSMKWGNGYVDFAGSGVVHAMGGAAAIAGAIVLGPRIGKFDKTGKPRALPGHNIPLAMLGTFILLFGWFGFNAASTLAASDPQFATIATNTALAAAFGATAAMVWIMLRTKKPDPGMMANGMLAGLVAITAPCAFVEPWAAAVIGIVAGVLVIESVFFIERKLKLDDPVGAISVHGVCGIWGVLAVGIFANGEYGAGWNGTDTAGVKGLLYGSGGGGQFLAQLAGAVVLCTVMVFVAWAFFKVQALLSKDKTIRSLEDDEIVGLDLPEMGVFAYPDFAGTHEGIPAPAGAST